MKKRLFAVLLTLALPSALAFADTASFSIRSGETLLGPWIVTLPDASSSPIFITPNSGTTSPIEVSAGSVLGALVGLDAEKDDFSMSDVHFYNFGEPYAGGLYMNCLTISSATSTPFCGNWQYSINGVAPFQGAGVTSLHANDTVFIYFGSPRHVSLSVSSVTVGNAFTATAQAYDPATNIWVPATGVTIGVTQPDPNNPWSPIEVATSTVDVLGQATFTLSATGTYAVGIKEDYYAPAETLAVTDVVLVPPTPAVSSSGGGGYSHTQLNVSSALAYLTSKQNADGSFGAPLLTDWASIALASTDTSTAKTKLRDYLLSTTPVLSNATDYERRAIALLAMGINPYSGTSIDYITPIVQSFDGTQIGDPSLDNDDIFAIFPLLHAGYSTDDLIIKKTTAFILSAQQQDGSWDNSVDMTSAAVQALSLTSSLPNASQAVASAKSYLRTKQQSDGGFNNSFSTSWVIQAIVASGESPSSWSTNVLNPNDYLANLQQQDGGVEPVTSSDQTRLWATAYAIPAVLGKTWDSLLQSYAKPTMNSGTSGGATAPTATTTASLTTATTTIPVVATTTQQVIASSTSVGTTTSPSRPLIIPAKQKAVTATSTKRATQKMNVVSKQQTVTAPAFTSTSSVPTQTASAANISNSGIFQRMWQVVVSFFQGVF